MARNKNSGTIIQMADGRIGVLRHDQPLLRTEAQKIIIHLLDSEFKPEMDGNRQKTLLKSRAEFEVEKSSWKAIGMFD